ncbi:hypothetical protein FHX76_001325 [Lysinibacter cavernae]|uniref:Uncharacterized protein n=1 Tax=Lysinibacter cavernae TaxID=1640652 RepID=A0A7X5R0X4_9MICO|nr:hypothetical protein [Lysinibacter cavernae]
MISCATSQFIAAHKPTPETLPCYIHEARAFTGSVMLGECGCDTVMPVWFFSSSCRLDSWFQGCLELFNDSGQAVWDQVS